MEFEWVAIALGDVAWISIAFALGFLARTLGLPPLVGFLAAGFLLNAQGIASGEMLQKLSDLGVTLLLFTVGLKLSVRTLAQPQVWAVTGLHTAVVVALFGAGLYAAAATGLSLFAGMDFASAMLIAFSLSFSSTVFVVKILEEKGEVTSLHGRIAIGILIVQDLAAVVFLAASTGTLPSPWAWLVLLLFPLRFLLLAVLRRVGHGELLVLYGFLLALGGAGLFDLVGLKGDLGALVLGVLIANDAKAEELAKTMLGFKDLFLLGFFLSVGLSGPLTTEIALLGAALTPLILLKGGLFFVLLIRFRLRARTSLLASLHLTNFSEFGLIVAAIAASNGWIEPRWLIVIAVALSLSFAVAAALNRVAGLLYGHYRERLQRLQHPERLPIDPAIDIGAAKIIIVGTGGVGSGAYDRMREQFGDTVVGVDIDPVTVENHQRAGRRVLLGDPSDADFWDRVQAAHSLELVMLALPKLATSIAVLRQLKDVGFDGRIAAIARFPDEVGKLEFAGADTVFNIYTEAGAGFAAHVAANAPA